MIEQVMQQKKRYEAMVQQFTQEQFTGWFIEFFKLYPFITKIQWLQYTDTETDGEAFRVYEPELELSSSYIEAHKDLVLTLSDTDIGEEEPVGSVLDTYYFRGSHAAKDPALASAVKAIEELFEAEDVLQHVFGEDVLVTATAEKIEVEAYD